MARSRSGGDARTEGVQPPSPGWADLTWDDLDRWAGRRSVQRGRTYQRGGRVKDLRISREGVLLATVVGGARYATSVSLSAGRNDPALESTCTCPIGGRCKHAVAIIADYLDAVANTRTVPVAAEDDPRWAAFDVEANDEDAWDEEEEGEPWEDDDEELTPIRTPRTPKIRAPRAAAVNWAEKIDEHIRAKSRDELAELVCSLVRRYRELHQEFQERLALQNGDVKQLLDGLDGRTIVQSARKLRK